MQKIFENLEKVKKLFMNGTSNLSNQNTNKHQPKRIKIFGNLANIYDRPEISAVLIY